MCVRVCVHACTYLSVPGPLVTFNYLESLCYIRAYIRTYNLYACVFIDVLFAHARL